MINEKLHKWVFASIAKHIKDAAEDADLPLVVELLDTRSDSWKGARHRGEAHIVGPHTKEESKNYFRVEVGVFVTVSSHLHTNAYLHLDKVGKMANALDRCILIMSYLEDTVAEVMKLTPDEDIIKVTHIKPAMPDQINHSTIEVKYLGFYQED